MSQPKSNEKVIAEIMKGVPAIEMTVDIGGERDIVDIREELEERIRVALAKKDKEVVEAINEALLTKAQYAELARGWGAEGSDRYEGYIQGAMDVNGRVIWNLAGKGIAIDMGSLTPKE